MSSTSEVALLDRIPTGLFIGGCWREASNDQRFDVEDPATGERLIAVADATESDARAALDAACAAQEAWASTPARERAEILRRAFELVNEQTDDFALLMTLEMGKPLAESRAEVAYGAEFLRWFSEEACRIDGGYRTSPDGSHRLLVTRRPVGPCLLVTPWNFPLAMGTRKIAPALAAGCTVVLKPASLTPLTSLLLADVLRAAGVPDGVVNVIPTSRASQVTEPLLSDARLRKLSFTGSTPVGRRLLAASAEQVLRVSMELGGNAPFLVFADADLDAAVEGAVLAKMRNTGEACVAANRFLVEASIHDAFAERLAARLASMKLGRGTDDGVELGPLINADAVEHVHALVEDAVARGARVLCGGGPTKGPGHFYAATVLADVPRDAAILGEEFFGPVAPIVAFESEDEAVALANETQFGLVSYAFTSDLARGLRLADLLDAGMIGLNTGLVSNPAAPFGGVKQSGLGREGGRIGIDEYLETIYVGIGGARERV